MNLPEYITKEEVQRVCKTIGIRDWTILTKASVPLEEAEIVRSHVGGETLDISSKDFRDGLEVELEHGLVYADANITNNHPILTGRIVLAHLKEMLDYYIRLTVAEIEGDMHKAAVGENPKKLAEKYKLWIEAKANLTKRENSTVR